MRIISQASFMLAAGLVGGCLLDGQQADESTSSTTTPTARLSGAIYTTLPDGSAVNANIYPTKTDVYLDGGPGDQAPASAGALPEGDYYFQVTDPSGKVLLSQDAIECREFHVNGAGLISAVGPAACSHLTGLDVDHGALTVQLAPYADTPNNGGEYKVWVTPVDEYEPGHRHHGFVGSESKTDNYKVKKSATPPPPCEGDECPCVGNECPCEGDSCNPPPPPPCCGDGHLDAGEECDDGNTTDGDGCSATCVKEVVCNGNGHGLDKP